MDNITIYKCSYQSLWQSLAIFVVFAIPPDSWFDACSWCSCCSLLLLLLMMMPPSARRAHPTTHQSTQSPYSAHKGLHRSFLCFVPSRAVAATSWPSSLIHGPSSNNVKNDTLCLTTLFSVSFSILPPTPLHLTPTARSGCGLYSLV